MKRILFFASVAACSIVFCSCGSEDNSNTEAQEVIEETVVEAEQVDSVALKEAEERQKQLDEASKVKAVNEIKSWGARSAKFDNDNFFVVGVYKSDISASADDVAKQYYDLYAEEVSCMKGCIIIDAKTQKELGRYPSK